MKDETWSLIHVEDIQIHTIIFQTVDQHFNLIGRLESEKMTERKYRKHRDWEYIRCQALLLCSWCLNIRSQSDDKKGVCYLRVCRSMHM